MIKIIYLLVGVLYSYKLPIKHTIPHKILEIYAIDVDVDIGNQLLQFNIYLIDDMTFRIICNNIM